MKLLTNSKSTSLVTRLRSNCDSVRWFSTNNFQQFQFQLEPNFSNWIINTPFRQSGCPLPVVEIGEIDTNRVGDGWEQHQNWCHATGPKEVVGVPRRCPCSQISFVPNGQHHYIESHQQANDHYRQRNQIQLSTNKFVIDNSFIKFHQISSK